MSPGACEISEQSGTMVITVAPHSCGQQCWCCDVDLSLVCLELPSDCSLLLQGHTGAEVDWDVTCVLPPRW
jgi:hypothetical protein